MVGDLAEPHPTLNFTFPSEERFVAGDVRPGRQDGTAVVIYDRNGMMWATRVWWLLRAYGFDNAGVLDGGWQGWAGPVSDDPAPAHDAQFIARPRPRVMASIDEVASGPPCLLNALAPDVFRGETNRYGRAGRIPGSVNVFAKHLLDPSTRPAAARGSAARAARRRRRAGRTSASSCIAAEASPRRSTRSR